MRRTAVIGLLLGALILAACGQKAGVHVASGRTGGALIDPETGEVVGGDTGSATGAGDSAAAAGGTSSAAGAAGGSAAGGTRAGATNRAGGATGGATAAGSGGGGGPGNSTGVTDKEITIGIHAPVTGAAPFPATSFNDGKDVYFSFINGKGGINSRTVKVVFEDDGYNPSQAVGKCKKMVEQDKVFMLVGGGGTDQIVACAQYAAGVGVPYVAEGVSEQGLNTLQNYFAISMTYKQQAPLLAQYMKNVLHVTKVGMIRGNTANFDDAHNAFLQAATANGLQVVVDKSIDKNADSGTAFSAGGSICADPTKRPEAMYPLIAPSIWVQIVAGAQAQACTPIWSGVGLTQGLNTVGTAVCGAAPNTKAHFFSPFPGLDKSTQFDPDYQAAYNKKNGKAGDDIGWALWAAEKSIAAQLTAAGRSLTRQSYIAAVNGKSFTTGVSPPVNYATSRFGGTGVHVVNLNCGAPNAPYQNEANFKSGF